MLVEALHWYIKPGQKVHDGDTYFYIFEATR